MNVFLFIIFLYALSWGFVVREIASDRGYHGNWFWCGFFFDPFAYKCICSKPLTNSALIYKLLEENSNKKGTCHGSFLLKS